MPPGSLVLHLHECPVYYGIFQHLKLGRSDIHRVSVSASVAKNVLGANYGGGSVAIWDCDFVHLLCLIRG